MCAAIEWVETLSLFLSPSLSTISCNKNSLLKQKQTPLCEIRQWAMCVLQHYQESCLERLDPSDVGWKTWGNNSPRNQYKEDFGCKWSLGSIPQVIIGSEPLFRLTLDPGFWGNYGYSEINSNPKWSGNILNHTSTFIIKPTQSDTLATTPLGNSSCFVCKILHSRITGWTLLLVASVGLERSDQDL